MSRSRCTSIVRSPKHAWQLLLTDAADGAGGDTDSLGGKEPCSSQSVILRSGMLMRSLPYAIPSPARRVYSEPPAPARARRFCGAQGTCVPRNSGGLEHESGV